MIKARGRGKEEARKPNKMKKKGKPIQEIKGKEFCIRDSLHWFISDFPCNGPLVHRIDLMDS